MQTFIDVNQVISQLIGMNLLMLGSIANWTIFSLFLLFFFLFYLVFQQNGRLLWKIEALENALAQSLAKGKTEQSFPTLPIGKPAPTFQATDLTGSVIKWSDLLGKPRILLFFSPGCGHCISLVKDLRELDEEKLRQIVLLTTGDVEINKRFFHPLIGKLTVLFQEKNEISILYKIPGTPMAYSMDSKGNIADKPVVGPSQIMALLNGTGLAQSGDDRKPSLAKSRINRNGLDAGTPAPFFELPLIKGGTINLAAYKGRSLFLVFSDPECGPCQALVPLLEDAHQNRKDLAVLVISRRDRETNLKKVAEHHITFDIALQKSWEISMLYGIFATPVAYLINPDGIVTHAVARGLDDISALLASDSNQSKDTYPRSDTGDRDAFSSPHLQVLQTNQISN